MRNRTKLRARQDAMFKRHHAKPRPYDHAKKRADRRQIKRVMLMFDRGASIEEIAAVTGLTKIGVAIYRDVFYLPWKQSIAKH